jgi:ribulose-phosphate 3-epimerase
MTQIIPSIIGQNFTEVKTKITALEGLVDWVQLDISDGVFTPNVTWQSPEDLKEIGGKIKLEAHLMVTEPETIIEDWLPVVDRLVIHLEDVADPLALVERYQAEHFEIILAINLETPISDLEAVALKLKTVQVMSIAKLGFYGSPFESAALDKVSEIKARWPGLKIAVDGGVSPANVKALVEAGVDHLVVGSAIWTKANPAEAIADLEQALV